MLLIQRHITMIAEPAHPSERSVGHIPIRLRQLRQIEANNYELLFPDQQILYAPMATMRPQTARL
jgi:hypothetical protein